MPSLLTETRRKSGDDGVRALLEHVFATCATTGAACDALGLGRTAYGAVRAAARRVGLAWPYAPSAPISLAELRAAVDADGVCETARRLGITPGAISHRLRRNRRPKKSTRAKR